MRAKIRGTEIYFDVDGLGLVVEASAMRERPAAFLIHGGPGSDHTSFKTRFTSLRERAQVVYFDQRGHGRSALAEPRQCTLDENVEDLEALRNYLGIESFVSIGYSYGGKVAMAHAARYPGSVSRLVLISTAAHFGYAARARQIAAERGTPEQFAQCESLFAGRIDTVEKMRRYFEIMGPLYARSYDAKAWSSALSRSIFNVEALNRAHGPGGFLRSLDLRPELARIKAPTLVLTGRHDWICPPEFSEEIHALIPGSDLRIFEESSHSILADEPERCLDAIIGFLAYSKRG